MTSDWEKVWAPNHLPFQELAEMLLKNEMPLFSRSRIIHTQREKKKHTSAKNISAFTTRCIIHGKLSEIQISKVQCVK